MSACWQGQRHGVDTWGGDGNSVMRASCEGGTQQLYFTLIAAACAATCSRSPHARPTPLAAGDTTAKYDAPFVWLHMITMQLGGVKSTVQPGTARAAVAPATPMLLPVPACHTHCPLVPVIVVIIITIVVIATAQQQRLFYSPQRWLATARGCTDVWFVSRVFVLVDACVCMGIGSQRACGGLRRCWPSMMTS